MSRSLRVLHVAPFLALASLALLTIASTGGAQHAAQRSGSASRPVAAKTPVKQTAAKPAVPAKPVSFNNDIVPIFTRAGCNQGACHGAQYGKGGFKLSLAGFDTDLDYTNIAKQAKGRRIAIADPVHSLLLLKPIMAVPHGGGRRLEPASADYKILLRWLQEGAAGPNPADPTVTKIEVLPAERILPKLGETVPLRVRALYSDGSQRDVTAHARINSLNDAIAACTPEGVVTAAGKGQTAIMIRYSGQVAVATMIVPFTIASGRTTIHAPRTTNHEPRTTGHEPRTTNVALPPLDPADMSNPIDALVTKKQRQLGLQASPLCDDSTFIRRVFFDLIGTAPKPEEITAFLADNRPDKRTRLVDAVLERPEYADFWTLKWGDLLRSNRTALGDKGMWSFSNWIHDQMRENRPVNQFVHDLIVAQGSTFTNGPSNYYRVASNPQDLAETTSQVFLGVRLQCARCHHHPFEKWSQADYYQFAAFFARIGLKSSNDFGIFGNENVVRIQDGGEVTHPKTGKVMRPTALGAQLATLKAGEKLPDPDADGDRRYALADWLTSKDNRLFARNIANRYWGYMFSKGIVNPIDDQRVTNPPTNPELLDLLADELVKNNFDLKHLLHVICTTRTYQRSSEATLQNRQDELFFTHYLPKRLSAESLLDAIDFACGTQEKFPALPLGTRAIQLPDPSVGSDFLDVFGRPQRLIACECERMAEPNLSQTLRLMNGNLVNHKVSQGDGRLAVMISAKKSDEKILDTLYEVTLGRPPRLTEKQLVLGTLAFTQNKDRKAVFEDVFVTLLNSKEFLFIH